AETGQHLAKNQKVFRYYNYETKETSYFYRTNEKLTGQCAKPVLIKKNYRLGTRSLNPLSLLKLANKHTKKELYHFKKPKQQLSQDFQEFLITRLLLLCNKAEFLHTPLEQEHVPKEAAQCNQSIYSHFQTKPVLHFQFLPENAVIVRTFINHLDIYALEYDLEEKQHIAENGATPRFTVPFLKRQNKYNVELQN
ncbi:548_t:CDS:2, partial [Paraglomus brasilianum]